MDIYLCIREIVGMEWETIETAPKDGREIILFANGDVFTGEWKKGSIHFGMHGYWQATRGGIDFQPTHWMPLPKPPESEV
jgi:hypothetical protein